MARWEIFSHLTNCIFLTTYVVPSLEKIIPGLCEVFTVDNQVESANAEERSLFRRIKKAISFCTFFLFLYQLLIKLRNLGCILFLLSLSLMGLLVSH